MNRRRFFSRLLGRRRAGWPDEATIGLVAVVVIVLGLVGAGLKGYL